MSRISSLCCNVIATAVIFAAIVSVGAEKVLDAKRIEDLCGILDLSRPEFAGVSTAKTPEEKLNIIIKHFKNRPSDKAAKRPRVASKVRANGEAALEHRFVGQSAYGLVFRGKDEIDWDDRYVKDREWIWQFHRFYWMPGMAANYYQTHDPRYPTEWAFEINSWVRHMHAQKNHPGWRSLDMSIRTVNWTKTWQYFAGAPEVDAETIVNFLTSLEYQCRRIDERHSNLHEKKKINNWDTMQQKNLLYCAVNFPEFKRSKTWIANSIDRLNFISSIVVLPDGVINEYTTGYHLVNSPNFHDAIELCEQAGIKADFSPEYVKRIQDGVTAVMIWSHPSGHKPLFGDAFEGGMNMLKKDQYPNSPNPVGDMRSWIKDALKWYPDREDWRYFVTEGAEGKSPETRINRLDFGGFYTMRTDWTPKAKTFIVAKNSYDKNVCGHNHNDNMSFELSFDGKRVMIDSGSYAYYSYREDWEYFHSSKMHQTVTLDNQNNKRRGKCLWQKSFPMIDVTVLRNESAKDLAHTRTFMLVDDTFIVVLDKLTGSAAGELRCHYQFLPGECVMDDGKKFASNADIMLQGAAENGKLVKEDGWISYRYQRKDARPAFAFVRNKRKGEEVVFLTLIAPKNVAESSKISRRGNLITVQLASGKSYLINLDENRQTASVVKK